MTILSIFAGLAIIAWMLVTTAQNHSVHNRLKEVERKLDLVLGYDLYLEETADAGTTGEASRASIDRRYKAHQP